MMSKKKLMDLYHWGKCLDCGGALGKCWLDYGRFTAKNCTICDKILIKGKMITREELGL